MHELTQEIMVEAHVPSNLTVFAIGYVDGYSVVYFQTQITPTYVDFSCRRLNDRHLALFMTGHVASSWGTGVNTR